MGRSSSLSSAATDAISELDLAIRDLRDTISVPPLQPPAIHQLTNNHG
jgi:hypothetical protein